MSLQVFGINGCLIYYIFYIAYYLRLCYKLPAPLELTHAGENYWDAHFYWIFSILL